MDNTECVLRPDSILRRCDVAGLTLGRLVGSVLEEKSVVGVFIPFLSLTSDLIKHLSNRSVDMNLTNDLPLGNYTFGVSALTKVSLLSQYDHT